ncbi:MAG: hypothetical protein M1370_06050 [Bacteroidetes bacterium]|nr:hypothetical protein [Bacteroidota bacterium]MCL5025429.1 hypothetical protein [Chloroflexota bacterium]
MSEIPGFCGQCGAPLTGGGRFCRECIQAALAQEETGAQPPRAIVTIGPRVAVAAPRPARQRPLRLFAAVLLAMLAGGVLWWWLRYQPAGASGGGAPPATIAAGPEAPAPLTAATPEPSATGIAVSQVSRPPATATATAPDPAGLLGAAQQRLAGLRKARFTFQRTAFNARSFGRGWLEMPDRAEYTLTGDAPAVDWRVVRWEQWTRRDADEEWARGISSVSLVNNPTIWLQLLDHAREARTLPPERVDGVPAQAIAFKVAPAKPGDIDPALTALGGDAIVFLRQPDNVLLRLVLDLSFTAVRGETRSQVLQVSLDLSDWNASLPAITEPTGPTATPPI